ncbi:MAG: NfeD family protein, partial [Cyanobium sp.]
RQTEQSFHGSRLQAAQLCPCQRTRPCSSPFWKPLITLAQLLGLRRWSRRLNPAIPVAGSSDRAQVISGFGGGQELGRVRWQGQSWAAVQLEPGEALPAGTAVLVMGREGNRLQVLAEPPRIEP